MQDTNLVQDTNFITEFDQYLFGDGTHYNLYDKLGAHPVTIGDKSGVYFAVWARMQSLFLLWAILITGIRKNIR